MNDFILKLEEKLLDPNIRKSSRELEELLSDDFIEFGSSGRIFNKQHVIEFLQLESSDKITIVDFNTSQLSPDIVLATYKSIRYISSTGAEASSLRSSIWKLIDNNWKLVFHQGTPSFGLNK